ncbi:MAG: hypothetical protein ACLQVN_09340 [Bryobacteraceae bacterium]
MYYGYQFQTFVDMIRLLAPDMPKQMVNDLALRLWHGWLNRVEKPALSSGRRG